MPIQGITEVRNGDDLPRVTHHCDNVQLFLYNAALWNAHRIHFDYPYATNTEGYPGLVIAGPLIGDWLIQTVLNWMGEGGRLVSVEYSNRRAAYVGETLTAGGTVTSIDPASARITVDLFVMNEADEIIAPGKAIIEFSKE